MLATHCSRLSRSKPTVSPARRLFNLSQTLQSGEVLGIAGVSGNGQRTLAEVIAGLRVMHDGRIDLLGVDISNWSVADRIAAGLRYIPEERMHDGVIQEFSIAENIILQDHVRRPFSKGIFLDFKAIAQHSQELVRQFSVRPRHRHPHQEPLRRQHPESHPGARAEQTSPRC